jgi:hypothetical protein
LLKRSNQGWLEATPAVLETPGIAPDRSWPQDPRDRPHEARTVKGSTTYKGIISAEASATVIALGMLIACVACALVLTVFTRGKLGYPRYQREAEALDLPPSHS